MEAHKQLTIGLFGFGVVGEGLYKVLQQTPSLKASIKKVCIRNPEKKRDAPASLFTTDRTELLNDPEINVIVEVIDDSKAAFEIVSTALNNGKAVVSASKKMIAENLPALLQLQEATGLPFLYESSACASIPVIRNLEEYYDNDLLHSIKAIVNGSTNFILTKMFEDKLDFQSALLLAQQLGFAESNPKLDVEGYDALNKWVILLNHAYGIITSPEEVLFSGIQNIQLSDALVAKEKHYDIKLIAQAKKLKNGSVAAFVLPQFVKQDEPLSFVKNEYNGVVIESGFADKQFFYGKGAGSFPTASAVLSDISALRYNYRYEYKKLYHHRPHELTTDYFLKVYVSFDDWKYISKEDFEWIEEWHADAERKYLVGVLHVSKLIEGSWWKENNTSLILSTDPIIDNLDIIKLKKKSLELAGIV
ncbi:MAG: homoserine dehydrogenase [Sediminibacterium sp. Gen4]|jgi:homoserine dehydrogenase|uniref:homoserine dehydrogenase n=1 Tax=unclassified Sediminibacterium TaxID=2635961 RepID=UPI0015B8CC0F|nr:MULTISPECIES: homoserine dehydrogenase [unclassified Sediminibacterium]MBW0160910.1 homoserine dehydrogenase [Sediminibacterium sp.]MBW0162823.1 homoserine dehydrogenase [Sediminibacterium sp.]NWK67306.1 homoserine dehydrogenase [Sediminibacterium sp. Gen4]